MTQGDLVSKIGSLFGKAWEMRLDRTLGVIEAHTALISFQPRYKLMLVDVKEENLSRERQK
ncbi:MAG: hypothetical protein L0207_01320 [Chlamydiae bacterium]|nr:hypothetical protein [Chlamydiota bacterium]